MSKLIVDDIELASGDLFNVPSSLQEDSIIPISNGQLTTGTGLPTGNLKTVVNFSDGQPEYSTYTFSRPSNQLFGLRILFANIIMYSSAQKDITYDVIGSMGDNVVANNLGSAMNYSSVGHYNTSNTTNRNAGYGYQNNGYSMGGGRGGYNAELSYTDPLSQVQNWQHYMCFGVQNTGANYYRKVMGEGIVKGNASGTVPVWYSFGTSEDTSTNTNNHDGLLSTTPYEQIKFRHQTADMTISQGKILIMEIPK